MSWGKELLEKLPVLDPQYPEAVQLRWFETFDRLIALPPPPQPAREPGALLLPLAIMAATTVLSRLKDELADGQEAAAPPATDAAPESAAEPIAMDAGQAVHDGTPEREGEAPALEEEASPGLIEPAGLAALEVDHVETPVAPPAPSITINEAVRQVLQRSAVPLFPEEIWDRAERLGAVTQNAKGGASAVRVALNALRGREIKGDEDGRWRWVAQEVPAASGLSMPLVADGVAAAAP